MSGDSTRTGTSSSGSSGLYALRTGDPSASSLSSCKPAEWVLLALASSWFLDRERVFEVLARAFC